MCTVPFDLYRLVKQVLFPLSSQRQLISTGVRKSSEEADFSLEEGTLLPSIQLRLLKLLDVERLSLLFDIVTLRDVSILHYFHGHRASSKSLQQQQRNLDSSSRRMMSECTRRKLWITYDEALCLLTMIEKAVEEEATFTSEMLKSSMCLVQPFGSPSRVTLFKGGSDHDALNSYDSDGKDTEDLVLNQITDELFLSQNQEIEVMTLDGDKNIFANDVDTNLFLLERLKKSAFIDRLLRSSRRCFINFRAFLNNLTKYHAEQCVARTLLWQPVMDCAPPSTVYIRPCQPMTLDFSSVVEPFSSEKIPDKKMLSVVLKACSLKLSIQECDEAQVCGEPTKTYGCSEPVAVCLAQPLNKSKCTRSLVVSTLGSLCVVSSVQQLLQGAAYEKQRFFWHHSAPVISLDTGTEEGTLTQLVCSAQTRCLPELGECDACIYIWNPRTLEPVCMVGTAEGLGGSSNRIISAKLLNSDELTHQLSDLSVALLLAISATTEDTHLCDVLHKVVIFGCMRGETLACFDLQPGFIPNGIQLLPQSARSLYSDSIPSRKELLVVFGMLQVEKENCSQNPVQVVDLEHNRIYNTIHSSSLTGLSETGAPVNVFTTASAMKQTAQKDFSCGCDRWVLLCGDYAGRIFVYDRFILLEILHKPTIHQTSIVAISVAKNSCRGFCAADEEGRVSLWTNSCVLLTYILLPQTIPKQIVWVDALVSHSASRSEENYDILLVTTSKGELFAVNLISRNISLITSATSSQAQPPLEPDSTLCVRVVEKRFDAEICLTKSVPAGISMSTAGYEHLQRQPVPLCSRNIKAVHGFSISSIHRIFAFNQTEYSRLLYPQGCYLPLVSIEQKTWLKFDSVISVLDVVSMESGYELAVVSDGRTLIVFDNHLAVHFLHIYFGSGMLIKTRKADSVTSAAFSSPCQNRGKASCTLVVLCGSKLMFYKVSVKRNDWAMSCSAQNHSASQFTVSIVPQRGLKFGLTSEVSWSKVSELFFIGCIEATVQDQHLLVIAAGDAHSLNLAGRKIIVKQVEIQDIQEGLRFQDLWGDSKGNVSLLLIVNNAIEIVFQNKESHHGCPILKVGASVTLDQNWILVTWSREEFHNERSTILLSPIRTIDCSTLRSLYQHVTCLCDAGMVLDGHCVVRMQGTGFSVLTSTLPEILELCIYDVHPLQRVCILGKRTVRVWSIAALVFEATVDELLQLSGALEAQDKKVTYRFTAVCFDYEGRLFMATDHFAVLYLSLQEPLCENKMTNPKEVLIARCKAPRIAEMNMSSTGTYLVCLTDAHFEVFQKVGRDYQAYKLIELPFETLPEGLARPAVELLFSPALDIVQLQMRNAPCAEDSALTGSSFVFLDCASGLLFPEAPKDVQYYSKPRSTSHPYNLEQSCLLLAIEMSEETPTLNSDVVGGAVFLLSPYTGETQAYNAALVALAGCNFPPAFHFGCCTHSGSIIYPAGCFLCAYSVDQDFSRVLLAFDCFICHISVASIDQSKDRQFRHDKDHNRLALVSTLSSIYVVCFCTGVVLTKLDQILSIEGCEDQENCTGQVPWSTMESVFDPYNQLLVAKYVHDSQPRTFIDVFLCLVKVGCVVKLKSVVGRQDAAHEAEQIKIHVLEGIVFITTKGVVSFYDFRQGVHALQITASLVEKVEEKSYPLSHPAAIVTTFSELFFAENTGFIHEFDHRRSSPRKRFRAAKCSVLSLCQCKTLSTIELFALSEDWVIREWVETDGRPFVLRWQFQLSQPSSARLQRVASFSFAFSSTPQMFLIGPILLQKTDAIAGKTTGKPQTSTSVFERLLPVYGHAQPVTSPGLVRFLPMSRRLVSLSEDGMLVIWSAKNGHSMTQHIGDSSCYLALQRLMIGTSKSGGSSGQRYLMALCSREQLVAVLNPLDQVLVVVSVRELVILHQLSIPVQSAIKSSFAKDIKCIAVHHQKSDETNGKISEEGSILLVLRTNEEILKAHKMGKEWVWTRSHSSKAVEEQVTSNHEVLHDGTNCRKETIAGAVIISKELESATQRRM